MNSKHKICAFSISAHGCSGERGHEHGRLLDGPVDGRHGQVLGHGSRRRGRHGRQHDAVSPVAEEEATRLVHPGPGIRAREEVQAAEVPERAREGASGIHNQPHAHAGLHFLNIFN